MNPAMNKRNELLAQTVIKGLKSRNMSGYYAASREEALRILREERVAANCAYMLMQFIHDKEDPFSFLRLNVNRPENAE